jgi:hypothetical protein
VSEQEQPYENLADHARPQRSRVSRTLATTFAGLALVLGSIASIDVPPADQALQDLAFGAVLGATYGVTVLSVRAFQFRTVEAGFSTLLAVTTVLWFLGLQHQFAFASTTVFVVGQLLSVVLAAACRGATLWIGTLLVAGVGITLGWLLFSYLDPRIVLLSGIMGWGNDRLLGSSTAFQAAMVAAAITIWWLTRRTERSVTP